MTLIIVGLNHRSTPLSVLEQMTLSADALPKALAAITSADAINETVVLSTCNRTEVYVHAERFHDAYRDIRDALALVTGVDPRTFTDHLYAHHGDEAVEHLFAVGAGLDSAVLGEHEILGQVRTAWETARAEGVTGAFLDPLFDHALIAGKRVRTDTAIGERTASISQAAVEMMRDRLGDLSDRRVLLIGAGEVGAGVAAALVRSERVRVTVTNRTFERAEAVAAELSTVDVPVHVVPFDHLAEALADVDVIVSATGAPSQVLGLDHIRAATSARTGPSTERLLVCDLAVPRDVDPGVIALDNVDLLVLGDLQEFANRGLAERQKEAGAAREVMESEIARFRSASSAREVEPILGSMRRRAEAIRTGELDHYGKALADLEPDQREAVEALTKAIVNKLLHDPSVRLRDAAGSHRGDRLAQTVRELFDLS